MPGRVRHSCNPGSGEAEEGASLGLAGFASLAYFGESRQQETLFLKR